MLFTYVAPENIRKPKGLLIFSGVIDKQHGLFVKCLSAIIPGFTWKNLVKSSCFPFSMPKWNQNFDKILNEQLEWPQVTWLDYIAMNWKFIISWLNTKTRRLWSKNVISNYSQSVLSCKEFNGKRVNVKRKLELYLHFVAIIIMLSNLVILLGFVTKVLAKIQLILFFFSSTYRSFRKLIVFGAFLLVITCLIWDKFTKFTFLEIRNLQSETREILKFQKMN